jgi:uncharacterized protein (DUF1778 family)
MASNRDQVIFMRLKKSDKALFETAAALSDLRVSTWVREVALKAAREILDRDIEQRRRSA